MHVLQRDGDHCMSADSVVRKGLRQRYKHCLPRSQAYHSKGALVCAQLSSRGGGSKPQCRSNPRPTLYTGYVCCDLPSP